MGKKLAESHSFFSKTEKSDKLKTQRYEFYPSSIMLLEAVSRKIRVCANKGEIDVCKYFT